MNSALRRAGVFLLLALSTIVSLARADEPAKPVPSEQLEEILVVGDQPGPGLWRVVKGEHTLWVLGTASPLPAHMVWHSRQAEEVIARAGEVLAPPMVRLDIGFFRGLTLLPAILRARKEPSGVPLARAVPADVYARWVPLRDKYLGSDSAERFRPMVAAYELYSHALTKSGLRLDDDVWALVKKTADAHRVPVIPITVKIEVDEPKEVIRQFKEISRTHEVQCLTSTIDHLEANLGALRMRANEWAQGNVAALKQTRAGDEYATCFDALTSVPALRDRAKDARERVVQAWVAAAETALANHRDTFAVLPIGHLLNRSGWLERLRSRGYEVIEPTGATEIAPH